jgi:membrane fusion protein (multidrug efflux system)
MTAALAKNPLKEQAGADAPPAPSKKRTVLIGVGVAAAVGVGGWLFLHRGIESTDDAAIDAEVVAVAARTNGVVTKVNFEDNERVQAGRVIVELDPSPAKAKLAQAEAELEGARATAAAADADARLATTNAKASSRAATASLSAASAGAAASRDQIAEARAKVRAAETSLSQSKTDLDRIQRLVQSGALSQAQLDQATTTHETAQASVAQARANLAVLESSSAEALSRVGEASAKRDQASDVDTFIALAEARAKGAHAKVAELEAARDLAAIDLSYTQVAAPQAGTVSKKSVAVGQTISAGAPIAQLVPSKAVWVTANFKETQVGKMRAGQPVDVHVDALPGLKLKGTVESMSAATGSKFALLPPDNATGNFTKVVQRVPVRIRIDGINESTPLRAGMSVEVSVDTNR